MRLLLVVAAYYPESYGGAERQAAILGDALARLGVNVILVAPTVSSDCPLVETASFGTVQRIRVKAYPNLGGRHILSSIRWTGEFIRRFGSRDFKNVPIYVFHARLHALGPALLAAYQRSPLLIKLGGGGESSDFIALREKRYLYGRMTQSFLLRRADAYVANGQQIVEDLKALKVGPERIQLFPNGVCLPPRIECDEAIKARSGRRFVYTGRLHPDKRVGVLFDAALALRDSVPDFDLMLIGDGPDYDSFATRLISENAERGPVHLAGFQEDVYPALLRSDFFVSASLREGQSNSLLEAMSAGVIPVVGAASGVSDVVEDGRTGFIVGNPDSEGFAAAFRRVMDLPTGRRQEMAFAAREFAEKTIGIDSVASSTLDLLAHTMRARNLAFRTAANSSDKPKKASLK